MGDLSVFMKVVCEPACVVGVCGSVNFSSAEALILPLYSRFAYAHDMINCNTLSFLLSFTTRTHAHTSTHCHTSTFSYAHTQKQHCGLLKGKWWKGTVRRTASWGLFEKSVFFSFTCVATVAGSGPSRLFPANLVDFVYGQTASVRPVVQVNVSICLHWLVSHTQWLCTEAMGHNQLQLRSFSCCNNMSVCIIPIHWA